MERLGEPHRKAVLSRLCIYTFVLLSMVAVGVPAIAADWNPGVGTAKQAGTVVRNDDGTFSVPISILIQNIGDEPLVDVQVVDDVETQLAPATIVSITNLRATGAITAINPDFDGGISQTYTLATNQRLDVGEEATVSFDLRFDANGAPGPLHNQAMGWVRGEISRLGLDDLSTGGVDTDPDTPGLEPGDNPNPGDDHEPTPIPLPEGPPPSATDPVIGLAKMAGESIQVSDGIFETEITLTVENLGGVELQSVQVTDDLIPTFAGVVSFSVVDAPTVSGQLLANPGYDGEMDVVLLAPGSRLAAGAIASIRYRVRFEPGELPGPFNNIATAAAQDEDGDDTEDTSVDGNDPDPNGDGVPDEQGSTPIDADPDTPIGPPTEPRIGLAKSVLSITLLDTSRFEVRLGFTVENLGDVDLLNVQVTDDLVATFGAGFTFEVSGAPQVSGALNQANATYDGVASIGMLSGNQTLPVGEVAEIVMTLVASPTDNLGPFDNQGRATGVSPLGAEVSDLSDNGTNPDPDGDGQASEPGEDDPTPVLFPALSPAGDLVAINKSVNQRTVTRGDVVGYQARVRNLTDSNLVAVSLSDDLPGGFSLVEKSVRLYRPGIDGLLATADDEPVPITITGTDPVLFASFDLPARESVLLSYATRVGTGTTQGAYINTISALQANQRISALATAVVELVADPIFEQTSIIGKVFNDRDADGWQDNAGATGLRLSGGEFGEGRDLPDLRGRLDNTDPPPRIEIPLSQMPIQPLVLSTHQGTRLRIGPQGKVESFHTRAVKAGLSGQLLKLTMQPDVDTGGSRLVVTNEGIEEAGIPGVRLATVSGLTIETDQHGRYHLADVDTGRVQRGANFILKLDTATLPKGAQIVSENPRVLRLTQALMSQINFAVGLPEQDLVPAPSQPGEVMEVVTRRALADVEPVRFGTGRSDIPKNYVEKLRAALVEFEGRRNLRLNFVGHADPRPLLGALKAKYGDNKGLSAARAEEVAEFVRNRLEVNPDRVTAEGRGATDALVPNISLVNMAANRRVEIEVLWDEVSERTYEVAASDAIPKIGSEERTVTVTQNLSPMRFGSGSNKIADETISALSRIIARRSGDEVKLRVTGHTDDQPLGAVTRQRFENNYNLSEARAGAVAEQLQEKLNLPGTAFEVVGKGPDEPLTTNETEAGRSRNRRVTVALVGQQTELVERTWIKPLQLSESAYLAHSGRIWATEDPLIVDPRLDVIALTPAEVNDAGQLGQDIEFAAYSNYHAFVERFELLLFREGDTDLTRPLARIDAGNLSDTIKVSEPQLMQGQSLSPSERISYVLRATSSDGQFDQTNPRLINIIDAQASFERTPAATIWGQTNLAQQNILTQGSRVRLHGVDLDPGMGLQIEGRHVPVSEDGTFVYETQLPSGQHSFTALLTDENGKDYTRNIDVTVDDDYRFLVGLASITAGQNNLSGSMEPLSIDDHFDDSVFVDGRLAFYAKGKIRGKYLLTAQLDSTEDELSNFTDNLRREDPRRIFRQLDPDRYYPVYGDDSTVTSDVDTQGAFYLRLDWDRNTALWGNYNTGLTDTEFTQYNRSLYGAKFHHENNRTTRFGDARHTVTAFGSEAQSATAHVTFAATGGSLYYLRHTDLVQGSEKVWIEVRQRDTEQVVETQELIEGRDYEVDAIQGRIILNRPLSQVVNNRSVDIIRSTPLEGDEVFLLADYEYVPQGFAADELTYGGRGKVWVGDHVGIGASKVIDERNGTDYDLEGVDLTLKAGKGTYLSAEFARSDASQNGANFLSRDGGLSFGSQNSNQSGGSLSGEAIAVEGRVNLAEVSSSLEGDVRAWWKDRDAEFSAGRINQGIDTTDQGIDVHVELENVTISGGYSELEQDQIGSQTVARLQVDTRVNRWQLGVEGRYEDIERRVGFSPLSGRIGDGEAFLLGARVGFDLNEDSTVYAAVQTTADEKGEYEDNDLVTVGVNTKINERTAVSVEVSDGDRGSALIGGVEIGSEQGLRMKVSGGVGSGAISQFATSYALNDGHEIYGSYAVDPDTTLNPRNLLTLGQRRQFDNHTQVFTESQFGKQDRYSSAGHVFGMDYTGLDDWLITTTFQASDNENLGLDFERTAASVGARLLDSAYKLTTRLEYREDEGPGVQTTQYVTSNSFSWPVSESRRWLAQLNMSLTEDDIADERDGKFVEFDVGHAYRPVWNDRFNVLAKYSYLFDLPSEGQDTSRVDQRAHILAAEALYQLNRRWELGGKIALKKGERRFFRESGDWEEFGLRLAAIRARYHFLNKWDALIEYRWLTDWEGDSQNQGALLGVYRHLGGNFKIGVGYNFTDFDDDLKSEDYDNHGWYLDLIGKF